MKKRVKTEVSFIVLSAVFLVPVWSYAQIGAGLTNDNSARVRVNDTMEAELDTDVDASVDLESDSDVDVAAETEDDLEVDIDSEEREENMIEIKSETRGSLRTNAAGITVISSSQVKSEADLEIFSANLSAEEEEVAKVEIESEDDDDSTVEVVYKHRGRLFGFIPMTLKSTTIVETKSNSEVEVRSKMPWWAFLVAKKNYNKTELESTIKNNTSVKANAEAGVSAETRARIAEVVVAEIAAHANAKASVGK